MSHAGYIRHVWSQCLANPGVAISSRDISRLESAKLADWSDTGTLTTDGLLSRLRSMLHKRINRNMAARGRKQSYEYQIGLYRDSQRLADIRRRVRVYQFETPEISRRFGHLLSSHND